MPLIQLEPHLFTGLPRHPDLPGETNTPDLREFIQAVLLESQPLLNQFPSTLKPDYKLRSSPPAKAKVKLSRGWRTLQTPQSSKPKMEFWVCRQSDHQDSDRLPGTASLWEFHDGLRYNHAEHEMEYTPSVTSVKRLLKWNEPRQWDSNQPIIAGNMGYTHFDVELNLIVHTFHPRALIRPRAFISWTMSATFASSYQPTRSNRDYGFITVQIPFYLPKPIIPGSQHEGIYSQIMDSVPQRAVFAYYASVERIELLPPPSLPPVSSGPSSTPAKSPGRYLRWTMLTTSEAGGKIPKCIQRNWTLGGVPRAVVGDVGLFIRWTIKRREERRLEQDTQMGEG
ncbi:Serine-threonine protein kinase 19 [Penicillium cf. griseofulvum]|uniref:Serine-threonine protein kinase 19 n=1 Tax=Penicillium cf. griseofulvum TaxID=2972120 RepID=A0A9W9MFH4_9EURO|nr:Serine-threonine protein kinase 19 [Penicillium cf. griseofulvum]KAJ5423771.1 Serine-threonine protein kinase 19 [Penicillium cf. griseofulvum]KAJ5430976.1 Serine-threonine protein kinase 19 [Penicillium cf. griseofulvum]